MLMEFLIRPGAFIMRAPHALNFEVRIFILNTADQRSFQEVSPFPYHFFLRSFRFFDTSFVLFFLIALSLLVGQLVTHVLGEKNDASWSLCRIRSSSYTIYRSAGMITVRVIYP